MHRDVWIEFYGLMILPKMLFSEVDWSYLLQGYVVVAIYTCFLTFVNMPFVA